ncbi:MAG TPA: hypothetical protein VNB22_11205 [Pyrinomonadaceae bacterium]|jgi:hypothetical protein|nr:hypothetical protein [Pyrinomonadaceae bacterium]
MLVIRQEQIDALIKGTDEEFVEFLVGHVKEEFPEKAAERDRETLHTMVRGGIRRAESHGFTTAEDITAFISIMFEIAPNFDEHPQIKTVLDDETFAPEDRIERLWSPLVTEEAWEEAAKNYNEKAWFPEDLKPVN